MKGMKVIWALVSVSLVVAGCGGTSSSVRSREETGVAQTVHEGVVVAVKEVTIEGKTGLLATLGAGYLGYRVGGTIGGGSGRKVAEAAGAVAGAGAGAAGSKALTKKDGLEITVKLDSGETMAIVQIAGDETFNVGDRVRVLMRSDGAARVTRAS